MGMLHDAQMGHCRTSMVGSNRFELMCLEIKNKEVNKEIKKEQIDFSKHFTHI